MELSELQKTQAAYAHFTLEEWKLLANLCQHPAWTPTHKQYELLKSILTKMPSAVL